MGSAASLQEYQQDSVLQDAYRREIASVFAEEFDRLKNIKNFNQQDLEKEFIEVLREREPAVLAKLGLVAQRPKVDQPLKLLTTTMFDSRDDHEASFRKLCVDTVDNIRAKASLTLMCAVDGSDSSDTAFTTMMALRKRVDTVCVFHAWSKGKDPYLAEHYQQDYLHRHYEEELLRRFRVPLSRFSFDWQDRKGRDVKQVLLDVMQNFLPDGSQHNPMASTRRAPNFFFMGYSGRKRAESGDSVWGPDGAPLIGSTADTALRCIHIPLVIVKRPISPGQRKHFVICVDGSPLSRRGFDTCLSLVSARDCLHVMHVYNPRRTAAGTGEPSVDEIDAYYSSELLQIGPTDSRFVAIASEAGQSIGEAIVSYCNGDSENSFESKLGHGGVDFVCLAPRTRPDLTGSTDYVLRNVSASVILCKN